MKLTRRVDLGHPGAPKMVDYGLPQLLHIISNLAADAVEGKAGVMAERLP